jgi:hypothetical protein
MAAGLPGDTALPAGLHFAWQNLLRRCLYVIFLLVLSTNFSHFRFGSNLSCRFLFDFPIFGAKYSFCSGDPWMGFKH